MEVVFGDDDLDKLEADATFPAKNIPQGITNACRKRIQLIRFAPDERDFYNLKSLHFERLEGKRKHQHSMRLNDQYRLILEILEGNPGGKVGKGRRDRGLSLRQFYLERRRGMEVMERKFADVFSPGEFIKEELDARGWTQDDLAEILGRPLRAVNDIVNAKRGITPETAKGLGEAFGTSAQLWMNLESAYRLSLEKVSPKSISRKAVVYSAAPIRAMIKRNWIEESSNIEVLEQSIKKFFGTADVNHIPELSYMARKSTIELTLEQKAWLFRVKNLSQAVHVQKYLKARLNLVLEKLRTMLVDEADIRLVPKVLSDAGIKLLIVEPLPQSKIDGVSFWVDGSPAIALSLRFDRVDSFWHTLMHEIAHIKNEDGLKNNAMVLDTDLFDRDSNNKPYETAADNFAINFLVPQNELDSFIMRTQPLYSKSKIVRFANAIKVHPGILVGQLQHRGRELGGLDYSHSRDMLTKVRPLIVNSALTDGYGQLISIN